MNTLLIDNITCMMYAIITALIFDYITGEKILYTFFLYIAFSISKTSTVLYVTTEEYELYESGELHIVPNVDCLVTSETLRDIAKHNRYIKSNNFNYIVDFYDDIVDVYDVIEKPRHDLVLMFIDFYPPEESKEVNDE